MNTGCPPTSTSTSSSFTLPFKEDPSPSTWTVAMFVAHILKDKTAISMRDFFKALREFGYTYQTWFLPLTLLNDYETAAQEQHSLDTLLDKTTLLSLFSHLHPPSSSSSSSSPKLKASKSMTSPVLNASSPFFSTTLPFTSQFDPSSSSSHPMTQSSLVSSPLHHPPTTTATMTSTTSTTIASSPKLQGRTHSSTTSMDPYDLLKKLHKKKLKLNELKDKLRHTMDQHQVDQHLLLEYETQLQHFHVQQTKLTLECSNWKKKYHTLVQEKQQYVLDITDLEHVVKLKEQQIMDLEKKVMDTNTYLKQVQDQLTRVQHQQQSTEKRTSQTIHSLSDRMDSTLIHSHMNSSSWEKESLLLFNGVNQNHSEENKEIHESRLLESTLPPSSLLTKKHSNLNDSDEKTVLLSDELHSFHRTATTSSSLTTLVEPQTTLTTSFALNAKKNASLPVLLLRHQETQTEEWIDPKSSEPSSSSTTFFSSFPSHWIFQSLLSRWFPFSFTLPFVSSTSLSSSSSSSSRLSFSTSLRSQWPFSLVPFPTWFTHSKLCWTVFFSLSTFLSLFVVYSSSTSTSLSSSSSLVSSQGWPWSSSTKYSLQFDGPFAFLNYWIQRQEEAPMFLG